MKKSKKYIIIGMIGYVLIAIFATYKFYNNDDDKNFERKYVLDMLKKSQILENEIGTIKSIELKKNKHYPYKELGYWAYYKNFTIVNENNQKYYIKIIFNDEYTYGIYAYEINGKIIYEDIEKVQPNINEFGEIIV